MKSKITKRILKHILFWIGVFFFYVFFFTYSSGNYQYSLWTSGFILPITIALSYFIIYYLIPKYLLTKKYLLFALYSFYTFIISTYLIFLTIFASFIYLSKFNFLDMPKISRNYVFILILIYLIAGIFSFIHLLNNNSKTVSENKELENKFLATKLLLKEQELLFLKSQIHPHFLFNTLNTIYGFALNNSKETPDLILKLSELLDYILYQVKKNNVSLNKEISHIQKYIELEKIRFQDSINISEQIDNIPESFQIAPMMLIPLIENAFKHGSIINEQLSIEIKATTNKKDFFFSIKNTFQANKPKSVQGIGIENLKKRLELNYKDNYELNFETNDNWFIVSLKIFNINQQKENAKV
ncbi:MAG: histidine kinase [Bacteroidota bacterium]|nr:histidine kinase [Bacteroidota bacterium]